MKEFNLEDVGEILQNLNNSGINAYMTWYEYHHQLRSLKSNIRTVPLMQNRHNSFICFLHIRKI